MKEDWDSRHAPERLYIVKSGKGKKKKKETEKVILQDRNFFYLTRESAVGIKPEEDYKYNMFLGHSGRDEEAWTIACEEIGVAPIVQNLLFGTPSLNTIIEHLKRFDHADRRVFCGYMEYHAEAKEYVVRNEGNGERTRWNRYAPAALGETTLTSFPGIHYRAEGVRRKVDAENDAMYEATVSVRLISEGQRVLRRPVALFGRGKRVVGGVESGDYTNVSGGRLVMAPDLRDHLIMLPLANGQKKRRLSNWKQTECMPGMSWQNGGSIMFLYNMIVDMVPEYGERLNPFGGFEPSNADMFRMEGVVKSFKRKEERDWRFFCLDIRRQDSSVSCTMIDEYFAYTRSAFQVDRGKKQRRFGRWAAWCCEWMKHTRIALPDGQVWQKHGGNVSGSPFTTELNTYSALLSIRGVMSVLLGLGHQKDFKVRVYGDNIVLAIKRSVGDWIELGDIGRVLEEMYGQVLNPEESYSCNHLVHSWYLDATRSVSFLGKHVTSNGSVWRPATDTISSLVAPDGDSEDKNIVMSRCMGLLIDNPFNMESVSMLEEYMDKLTLQGCVPGGLPSREKVKNQFKMAGGEPWMFTDRISVAEAQMLYLFTRRQRVEFGLDHATFGWSDLGESMTRKTRKIRTKEQLVEREIEISRMLDEADDDQADIWRSYMLEDVTPQDWMRDHLIG
jgi:hypothetical protein